jgi:hypothetical protein
MQDTGVARCLSCGRRYLGEHLGCPPAPPPPPDPSPAAPAAWPTLPGYRVEGRLGGGGFGEVLSARRVADGARAAVKIAPAHRADAAAQLLREEAALRAIGPPAVPALLEAGRLPDGARFLAMELLEGPTLATRLAEVPGPLPAAEAAGHALGLLAALARIHAARWAHGDVTPENVVLATGGARLLDLGGAEPLHAGPPPARHDDVVGTAEYLAPERCEGAPPDARSDVYAAASVIFELLTGRPPHFGPEGAVRQAQVTRRPPRPSSLAPVPAAVEEVVLGALGKDPATRPADAAALREALAAALDRPGEARGPAAEARPAATAAAERRTVGVVLLEGVTQVMQVRALASRLGGQVAQAAGGRCAVVFDPASSGQPARMALRGAEAIVEAGLARRALVDLVAVSVQRRAGGEARYLSADLTRPDAYPAASDPPGVLATPRLAALLPEEPFAPEAGRPDRLRRGAPQAAEDHTAIRREEAPFVGRAALLSRLEEVAAGALGPRRPAVVAIVGEAGTGKSALAHVLGRRLTAVAGSPQVISLRAPEPTGGEPQATLGLLLRAALGLPRGGPAQGDGLDLLQAALPGLEPTWPALALALGWLDPASPRLRALAEAPGALRALSVRGCGEALRRQARERPLCLLLDDAHYAEGAALDAIEYATLAEAASPLFACVLGRPSLASARPSFGERAARAELVELDPLGAAEAADLCRRLLLPAEHVPARAVERLVERAGGNPLLLVELVRGLKQEGLVRTRTSGQSAYLATEQLEGLPELPAIEWIATRELAALPPDLAMHARLAALLADEFGVEELAGVLAELERSGEAGRFPMEAGAASRALLAEGLLVRHRGGRLGFRHLLLRDAVARSVPEPLRLAIHRAACRYGQAAPLPAERRLAFLVRHAGAAGQRAEAAAAALELGGRAAARHAYVEAEGLFGRALDSQEGAGPARLAALRGRGVMRYRLGRYPEAVDDLGAAREEARRLGDAAAETECLLDEATSLDWSNEFVRSARRVEEAGAAAGEAPAPALAARLALGRGRSLWRDSRWAEACATLEQAERAAEALGETAYETRVIACIILGAALPPLGRTEEAEAALARAEALAREREDALHLGAALNNRRNLRVARRDLEGALEDQRASIRLGRELGLSGVEYYAEYNIGELLTQAGRAAEAAPHVERAAELERRHPEVAPVPLAQLLAARLLLSQGDLAGARARLDGFRAAAAAAAARDASASLGPSEVVLADMVELATRAGSTAEWEALLARAGRDSVEQEPVEIAEQRALAAQRAGRLEEAQRALDSALRLADLRPNVMEARLRLLRAVCSPGGAVPPTER